MRLLDKRIFRFVFAGISLFLLLLCEGDNGNSFQRTISIYFRYPFLVFILGLAWIGGLLYNKLIIELPSYLVLYGLLFYRLVYEMSRFIPFNFRMYDWFDYCAFAISIILLLLNLVLSFIPQKKVNN